MRTFVRSIRNAVTRRIYIREPLRVLSSKNILPKSLWKRLPVETTFHTTLPNRNSFLYTSIVGDTIGRSLYWKGIASWQTETVPVFCALAQQARLVLDIGANTGVYTLLACLVNQQARVIAFEPVPKAYELLVNNVHINGWSKRCETHCEAVSNTVGSTKFHIPFGEVPKSASLSVHGFRNIAGTLIDVSMTTIDNALHPSDIHMVDLVKIDVEGFEDKVLEGMHNVLGTSQPAIIVECNFDGPFAAVEDILKQHNYIFFYLTDTGKIPTSSIIPDKTGQYRNFLCVAQGKEFDGVE